MSSAQIKYISGDKDLLDRVEPLWKKLNEHHRQLSPYFQQEYEVLSYAQRQIGLQEKAAEGTLLVELAEDSSRNMLIGFCISSMNKQKQGEIESIFVSADYRGRGIGDHFIKKALSWMDELEAIVKTIHVASGNETAFSFYARYGFFPRQTILKQRS